MTPLPPAPTALVVPEAEAAVSALRRRFDLGHALAGFAPYCGDHATVVPHLTVAHGDAGDARQAADALGDALRLNGPIMARCSRLSLLENIDGRWRERARLSLPSTPGATAP